MFQKFEIRAVHMTADNNLKKYVTKKIGHLDRYLSKHNQASAHAEISLKESKAKDKRQCTCEVTLYLPKETINVRETTINMYASVDIVEAKLKLQLKKYKDTHNISRLHRRFLARLSRQASQALD